jgi:glycosyltransferase involved in cell wall biosynthesis
MRIALISFEFPPDTAFGGIATYVAQAAKMLHFRGHDIEVFCASEYREGSFMEEDILVHRTKTADRANFRQLMLAVFTNRHNLKKFDLMESPEYNADGLEIKRLFPDLPLVVKLHTPTFLINQLNTPTKIKVPLFMKMRVLIAGWRRLKRPNTYWKYSRSDDPEYWITKIADYVVTPSKSLGEIVRKKWSLGGNSIRIIPYPYVPTASLTAIPLETQNDTVSYFGRLEVRKGVAAFAKVIPLISNEFPNLKFRFIGKDLPSPVPGKSMQEFLSHELKNYIDKIEFVNHVPGNKIPMLLAQTDICIFPSLWENFPNVCLEAMSAGRGIVASREGGMQDMLEDTEAGVLVDPYSEKEIAEAILFLANNRDERISMGGRARCKLLKSYSADEIGKKTEQLYLQAINRY